MICEQTNCQIVTLESYELVMGMFEFNNTFIGLLAPLQRYLGLLYQHQDTAALQSFQQIPFEPEPECEGTGNLSDNP